MNEITCYGFGIQEGDFAPVKDPAAAIARVVRAAQPVSVAELAGRLGIEKTELKKILKPLVSSGALREEKGAKRGERILSLNAEKDYLAGVYIGVRSTQVGLGTLSGEILAESEFVTPSDVETALGRARRELENLINEHSGERTLRAVGITVPGMVDSEGRLLSAPNLGWSDIDIAGAFQFGETVKTIVEADATAAAMYEARLKMRGADNGSVPNFMLVRSGTGIGVGLVIGGKVFQGWPAGSGISVHFGHMTIVAGGKSCACGNRGCWEKYASAASAASLYTGDRPLRPGESMPRFIEIVSKAENGEIRAQRTLEKIGDYLGIGIANAIIATGLKRVVVSGRLVQGWKFVAGPLNQAIERSIVGRLDGWTVEKGDPSGGMLGGALEVAADEYLKAAAGGI
jgi:predicted NBD/HSP70 family sugar kinase